jgi:hypothetical protein
VHILTDIEDIIELLGGLEASAEWARTSEENVSRWVHQGLPLGLHLRLVIEAAKRGRIICNSVLMLPSEEYHALVRMLAPHGDPTTISSADVADACGTGDPLDRT